MANGQRHAESMKIFNEDESIQKKKKPRVILNQHLSVFDAQATPDESSRRKDSYAFDGANVVQRENRFDCASFVIVRCRSEAIFLHLRSKIEAKIGVAIRRENRPIGRCLSSEAVRCIFPSWLNTRSAANVLSHIIILCLDKKKKNMALLFALLCL